MAGLGRTIALLSKASTQRPASPTRNGQRLLREVRNFGPNPGDLRMFMHAPSDLAPKAALVVVLHGCTQTAAGYSDGSGWIEAAGRLGFAVLCPEQTAANNPNLCFNWFMPGDIFRGHGEAASIAQMIAHAVSLQDIDPQRIFITGLSAGGAMANVLLATYPELFAAGAIIAGLPYGCASNVQEAFAAMAYQRRDSDHALAEKIRRATPAHRGRWPSISVWHGDSDATVSPAAGDAIVRQWAQVHDATPAPTMHSGAREWRSAEGDVVVRHVRIANMGHGAPISTAGADAIGARGPYLLDVGISSTAEILKSWGFGDMPPRQRSAEEAQPPSRAETARVSPPSHWRQLPTARPGHIDVADVINNALRAAGLLK